MFQINKTINIIIVVCFFLFALVLFLHKDTFEASTEKNILIKNGGGVDIDIYVPERPKRVVFLNTSSFAIWMALGGKNSVVGVPIFPSISKDIYNTLSDKTLILPNFSSFSLEKILVLKPDLVIMNGNEKRLELTESFKQAKIPFMTLPSRSFSDIIEEIQILGTLTNHEDLAKKEINRINSNIKKNADKIKNLKPKKAMLVFGTSASFLMATPDSRQGEILKLAGGENILSDDDNKFSTKFIPLSLEYAAKKDPDFIFFINRGPKDTMEIKIKEALNENSAWQTLRAVKENRVYVLPEELFSVNPGLNIDDSVIYLSNILYSENNT